MKELDLGVYQYFDRGFRHNVSIKPLLLPSMLPSLKLAEGLLTFVHRSCLVFSALQLFLNHRMACRTSLRWMKV